MTRRYFDCSHAQGPVRVTLGYDRPLDEFFLQVARRPRDENDEIELSDHPYVYLSLDDPEAPTDDLEYFRSKLRDIGITLPESMYLAVEEDALERIGNLIAEHFANGRIMLRHSD